MILSIHNYNMTMRKILVALLMFILFCPIAKGQTEYTLTINPSDFSDISSYDNTFHEIESKAVCSSDESKTIAIKWVSYNMRYVNNRIHFRTEGSRIYNKTNPSPAVKGTVVATQVLSQIKDFGMRNESMKKCPYFFIISLD